MPVRDVTLEPLLAVDDIQGDVLPGLPKKRERLLFFGIDDPVAFRALLRDLHVTSTRECLAQRDLIAQRKAAGIATLVPTPGLNVALTYAGLQAVGVADLDGAAGLDAFRAGMGGRTATLSDPPAGDWEVLGAGTPRLDGVFLVTGSSDAEIAETIALRLAPVPGNGWHLLHEEAGVVRPAPVAGHEHFGWADGVSQPGVRGQVEPGRPLIPTDPAQADQDQGDPGQDLLWPGEFVLGLPGQDGHAASFTTAGDASVPGVPFMAGGSFLVFRRLAQLVPEFDLSVKASAARIDGGADPATAELLGAQMVGRWKGGAPVVKAPNADDPTLAEGTPGANDFEFGDDREGLLCPWSAHVRKVYPRDDVRHNTSPTEEQTARSEAFTQTHRMMRRGIAFGPELSEAEALSGHSDPGKARGLLFLCYVTSLEEQFEFVQSAWVNAEDFSQPGAGTDAVMALPARVAAPSLGAAPVSHDPAKKSQLSFPRFVEMRGGAYFFSPSIGCLHSL